MSHPRIERCQTCGRSQIDAIHHAGPFENGPHCYVPPRRIPARAWVAAYAAAGTLAWVLAQYVILPWLRGHP